MALVLFATLMPIESMPLSHRHPRSAPWASSSELRVLPASASASAPPPILVPVSASTLSTSSPTDSSSTTITSRTTTEQFKRALGDNDHNDDEDDDDYKVGKHNNKKLPKYDFEIHNPAPNDTWISGMTESLSWVDAELPIRATLDFTLIPVDAKTNPEALTITRRPLLRYISAMERYYPIIVPYDLITREQLLREQEGEGGNSSTDGEILANSTTITTSTTTMTQQQEQQADIQSLARLIITAYDGKTKKVLARKSVFPIVIRKDHVRDRRAASGLPASSSSNLTTTFPETGVQGSLKDEEELLEKKDSADISLEDQLQSQGSDKENESDKGGDGEENNNNDDSVEEITNGHKEGEEEEEEEKTGEDETEKEMDINETTPTGRELGEEEAADEEKDSDEGGDSQEDPNMHMGEEGHHEDGEGEDEQEQEHEHGHDHSHTVDPNHFENEEDAKLWKEHEDDPGYNPPIKVRNAGTIKIKHWIDNKERFFVGAPYVFAWEYPEEGLGLLGSVSVYVEDALTAKRYDVVAGDLSSEIRFMYLHPTAIMMSVDPKRRIYLRARVELDLFKDGDIERYTGFSKTFWVERGAL
ncbi:hypothetical protein BGX28_002101 [Mortierella sp. GBA30]|nr:hypothetical protein BGX28_002101 [Mortierella sp. GBA30]